MGRSRSAAVKKARRDWEGILQLPPYAAPGEASPFADFFKTHLAGHPRVEVELGSGSGDFLLAAAALHPKTMFVGIEYAAGFLKLLRDRRDEEGRENILLVATDGKQLIREGLPEGSIDAFHIYFPDPWPKRSDWKKRSLTAEMLPVYWKALKPGSLFFAATDHADYAAAFEKDVLRTPWFTLEEKRTEGNPAAYNLETHFSRKYKRAGRTLHAFRLRRNDQAA